MVLALIQKKNKKKVYEVHSQSRAIYQKSVGTSSKWLSCMSQDTELSGRCQLPVL